MSEKDHKNLILYAGTLMTSGLLVNFIMNKLMNQNKKTQEDKQKENKSSLYLSENQEKMPKLRFSRERSFIFSRVAKVDDQLLHSKNSLLDEVKCLYSPTCDIERVNHLAIGLDEDFPNIESPLLGQARYRSVFGGEGFLPIDAFIYSGSFIISNAVFGPNQRIEHTKKWLKAGPRKNLFFDPKQVRAAIVTCGGLCPGLNVVIRELFMTLHFNYQVKEVYGIKFGYKGFYSYDWIPMDIPMVKEIQNEGGTILGSSRGGFDLDKIINAIIDRGINQVYCLGGDGTHGGVLELFKEIRKRKLKIAMVGIPKTIDNDIPIIDKSFGFETAVQESLAAIQSGWVEAHCAEYGVGLVRLMGRHAGFIAMEAVNASRIVNICLIPEFKFNLYGEHGFLEFAYQRLIQKGTLVIVAAEGAGEAILDYKVNVADKDASGNVKLEDVGVIIKNELTKYCKERKINITLKYIDPTYMIRTTKANPSDRQMCTELAQNAVHGAMAGFSGYTVGHVNNKVAYIPIEELLSGIITSNYFKSGKYANRVQPDSREWQRLLASTGQPSFLNDESAVLQKFNFTSSQQN